MPPSKTSPVVIVAADSVSLAGAELLPKRLFKLVKDPGRTNDELSDRHKDADVFLVRSTRKIGRDFLKKSNVKVIATFTKGTDHIDLKSAKEFGLTVMNAEEGNHISAAEHTMALILSIAKNIIVSDRKVRKGKFTDTDFMRTELCGKTIGIIGFGKVGSYVGKLCRAFGMNVMANDIDESVRMRHKRFKFYNMEDILRNADYISVHIPYNKSNDKFISRKMFSMMRPDSVFVNTSRGRVVDENALLDCLEKKKICCAGLDVFATEPNVNKRFLDLKNVLLTNHIAGKTIESSERISFTIFRKILKYYRGNNSSQ